MRLRPTLLALGLGGLGGLAAAGCSSATGPGDTTRARLQWAEHGPASYDLTLFRSCECLPSMTGPVVVSVVDGEVVARRYASSDEPVSAELAPHFPSVEALFALVDEWQRRRPARLAVQYDPTFGHPVHVFVDPDARMADDEIAYTVTALHPR